MLALLHLDEVCVYAKTKTPTHVDAQQCDALSVDPEMRSTRPLVSRLPELIEFLVQWMLVCCVALVSGPSLGCGGICSFILREVLAQTLWWSMD